ncbi:MAG: RNA-directed DNA polymerase [Paludibacteraceae bacterium]|nr:RNA-directed DNA polymerase [Paludibacteraceae bacterium]
MKKPIYKKSPIGSLESLSAMLGINQSQLDHIINSIPNSYKSFKIETGKKLKLRQLHEPKKGLKSLQKKLNKEIFENIEYPYYLHGGIKNRDYLSNARIHSGSKSLISLDIKDFYPNIRKTDVINIFKNLMRFPADISEALTKLVTLNGEVPQGSCCSSYIANLIFFNNEYNIVTKIENKGFRYTRLLDDITISSDRELTNNEKTFIINSVRSMIKSHRLNINEDKTKIESSSNLNDGFEVTGLWAKHKAPKVRKNHRDHIRHLVFICKKQAEYDKESPEYHALWNKASGKVAQLTRLNHAESNPLRIILNSILPEYNEHKIKKITKIADNLIKEKNKVTSNDLINKINKLLYELSIVSRTRKSLAYRYRKKINSCFSSVLKVSI